MTHIHPRRLLLALALPLAGCLPPSAPTPQQPASVAPPPPVLASLAAFATVKFLDPGTRHAVLETTGGAVVEMTAAPEVRNFGTLRQGTRVVVEYDANGVVRIAQASRITRAEAAGRMRATVREVAVGGGRMVLDGADGVTREVTLPNPPMMAFATRLRTGDEVAVTLMPASNTPAAAAPM